MILGIVFKVKHHIE
jgi:hypothetical protein